MTAEKRIRHQYTQFVNKPTFGCTAQPIDFNNLFQWRGTISQLYGTPYQDGMFYLQIKFPTDYPWRPMKVKFITKIYHLNISQTGVICIDILKDCWSPALNIVKILAGIKDLLMNPNPQDPLRAQLARLYLEQIEQYLKNCRQETKKYAIKNEQYQIYE